MPNPVWEKSLKATAMTAAPPRRTRMCDWTIRLTPMTNWVRAGRGLPLSMSLKICSNFGTMKTRRKARITMAMTRTMIG